MENKHRLSNYEQETIINFNEEEDTVNIFTASEGKRRKYLKMVQAWSKENQKQVNIIRNKPYCLEIELPKAWLARTIASPPRKLSEEERLQRATSLAKARAKK